MQGIYFTMYTKLLVRKNSISKIILNLSLMLNLNLTINTESNKKYNFEQSDVNKVS